MMNEDYLHIQGNVLHVLNVSVQTTTNKNNALRLLELLLLTAICHIIWGVQGVIIIREKQSVAHKWQ